LPNFVSSCGDVAIFYFFKDGGQLQILLTFGKPMCVTLPNFAPNGQILLDIWPCIDF